jgi:hypothetical protein
VDAAKIQVNGKCDFCFANDPGWVLPTESFETAGRWGSDGDWAACDSCAEHLANDDWCGLFTRAVLSWESRHCRMSHRQAEGLRSLYEQVARHRFGPLRRL